MAIAAVLGLDQLVTVTPEQERHGGGRWHARRARGFPGGAAARCLALLAMACWALVVAEAKGRYSDRTPFQETYAATWAPDRQRLLDDGKQVQLELVHDGGAGFASKRSYLFGFFSMQLKLVPGNSAGTVTAFYLSSEGDEHDELDFEFLGNLAGQPYVVQTNVFTGGHGGREQRLRLWFDPTEDFHTYSISWNRQQIIFFVDSYPIRVFRNAGDGVRYPSARPMKVYSSLWDGSSWATDGGKVKVDWSAAPFVASYRSFGLPSACDADAVPRVDCAAQAAGAWWGNGAYAERPLAGKNGRRLARVRSHFVFYDYCADRARYPSVPQECAYNDA